MNARLLARHGSDAWDNVKQLPSGNVLFPGKSSNRLPGCILLSKVCVVPNLLVLLSFHSTFLPLNHMERNNRLTHLSAKKRLSTIQPH